MKKRSLLFMAAAVVVLASCSKSEIETNPGNTEGEIMLKSSVTAINPGTRAAFAETDLNVESLTALVLTSQSTSFDIYHAQGTMTFVGDATGKEVAYNKPIGSGDFKYPTAGTPIYLAGLYPAENWTVSASSAELTLTGKEDFMLADIVEDTNPTSGRDYQTLAFEHQLTWIQIKLTGDNSASVDKSITVTGIKLVEIEEGDVTNVATVDLSNGVGAASVDYSGNAPLTCWNFTDDTAYTGTAAVTKYDKDNDTPTLADLPVDAYVLAPASTTTNDGSVYNYTFEVSYNEGGSAATPQIVRIALTESTPASLASKYVSLHLHFIGNQIKALATVGDWAAGPEHSEEI